MQLGGDFSHWSVLGQLATLDSVSLVCTWTVGHTRQRVTNWSVLGQLATLDSV